MARILQAPMIEWEGIASEMSAEDRGEVARKLNAQAEYLVRVASYFEERYGYGCGDQGHAAAVKAQNRVATRVRRALGFSIPKQDINF